ncbi:hypothetical protein F7725_013176 [Dissostichus mawsoni]|uniref:Mucin-4-like C8-3 domain-containing protein n=1 Tax=Dissostichus mawsoni TaxID=36200 RepID=A0A7J5YPD0_DISMA|nr:hypothetical protein F7725_013176 [Dissostichus mawsoni]
MLAMCLGEGAQFCKYDTLTTQSLRMGNATLGAYQSHLALTEALEQVVSCGWLPTPRNGKKNGTHYLEGSCLSFTCDEGFSLEVKKVIEGKSSPMMSVMCKSLRNGSVMVQTECYCSLELYYLINAGEFSEVMR